MSSSAVPKINPAQAAQAQSNRFKKLLLLLKNLKSKSDLSPIINDYINRGNSLLEKDGRLRFSAITLATGLGFLSFENAQSILTLTDNDRGILSNAITGFGWSNNHDAAEALAKEYKLKKNLVDDAYYFGQGLRAELTELDDDRSLLDNNNFIGRRGCTEGLARAYNLLECQEAKDAVYNKIMGLVDLEVKRVDQVIFAAEVAKQDPPKNLLHNLSNFFMEIIYAFITNGSADIAIKIIEELNERYPSIKPLRDVHIYKLYIYISELKNPTLSEIEKVLRKISKLREERLIEHKDFCRQLAFTNRGSFERLLPTNFIEYPYLLLNIVSRRCFSLLIELQKNSFYENLRDKYLIAMWVLRYFRVHCEETNFNNQEFIELLFRLYQNLGQESLSQESEYHEYPLSFLEHFQSIAVKINFDLKNNPKTLLRILSCIENRGTRKTLLHHYLPFALDDFIYDAETINKILALTENIVALLRCGITRTQALSCVTDGAPHDSSDLDFLDEEKGGVLPKNQIQVIASYLPPYIDIKNAYITPLFAPMFLDVINFLPRELLQIIADYLSPFSYKTTRVLHNSSILQLLCRPLADADHLAIQAHSAIQFYRKNIAMAAKDSASTSSASPCSASAVPGDNAVGCGVGESSSMPMAPPAALISSGSSAAVEMCSYSLGGNSSPSFFRPRMQAASSLSAAAVATTFSSSSAAAAAPPAATEYSELDKSLLLAAEANGAIVPITARLALRCILSDDQLIIGNSAEQKQPALAV